MLTVISIIGILAAIIITGISGALKSARSARCIANLRQMGPAFLAYSMDHNGRYPLSFKYGNDTPRNSWWYDLAPYLGLKISPTWDSVKQVLAPGGPLGCPVADPKDTATYGAQAWISYKMTRSHRDWMATDGDYSGIALGLPVSNIVTPAKSLLVADGRSDPEFSRWVPAPRLNGIAYAHKEKANCLFADGHVASFTVAAMEANWDAFYTHAVE